MDIDISNNRVAIDAAATSPSQIRRSYDRWLICLGFVVLFSPTLRWLVARWAEGDSYGHGFLVVPLALFFVHRAVLGPRPPTKMLLPFHAALAVLSLAWAYAYAASVEVVQDAVLPMLLLTAFAGIHGWQGVRRMLLPVALFVFAIPVWEYVLLPLQLLTARVVEVFLVATDFPVFVDGDMVHVTSGTFEVAGGCAGIRFLLVATILTLTYGRLYLGSPFTRIKLTLAGVMLALIVNWIRVATVVVIGEVLGMDHPLVADHAWLGWVLFAVALIPLFVYARCLERQAPPIDRLLDVAATDHAAGGRAVLPMIVVIAAMGIGPAWVLAAFVAVRDGASSVELPRATAVWAGPDASSSSWRPRFVGARAEALGRYRSAMGEVYVYVNVYTRQAQTAELVGNENSVIGDWVVVERPASIGAVDEYIAALTARPRLGRLWLIWYWYDVGGWQTGSDLRAKVYQGAMGLVGERRAGLIALATECGTDCAGAATTLHSFIADVRPSLADSLPPEIGEDPK
jgi:EpsI family protein